jgi:F0F1-type ATP synthase assembly protein I
MKDITKSPLFLGAMFIGLGLGFVFDHIPAGIMLGLGIGYILSHFFPQKEK